MFKGAALDSNQLNLFLDLPLKAATRSPTLGMDKPARVRWKSRIFDYQQLVRESQPVQQTTLFDLTPTYCDPGKINPFSLQLQSMAFWRFPANSPGESCIYFVVDSAAPLLLYIGETCRSNKRWKGTHDCKRYIEKYQGLHYQHQLSCSINMAFWWDTPTNIRPRQQMELELIQLWRSPFNRENWQWYGQPFG